MATKKKTTRPRTSGKGTKKDTKKTTTKNKRIKKENSKKIIDWAFYLTFALFCFTFYMVYRIEDLSPLEWLADLLKTVLAIGVPAYMYRAVATDKAEIEVKRLKDINKVKKDMGDDFVYEEFGDPDIFNS